MVNDTERVACPSCGRVVDAAEIVQTEMPGDWEEIAVPPPDSLPAKYHDAYACRVRGVHVTTDCIHCHVMHVN